MPELSQRWQNWYLRVLPAYWVFLFCTTHFPNLRLDNAPPDSDKMLHLTAFGILAFLFWRFFEAVRAVGQRFVWVALTILIAYAGFDEYLQQFVGRSTDWEDFLADSVGIAGMLAVLEFRRRSNNRRSRVGSSDQ